MSIASEGCCGTSGANDNTVTRPCKYFDERLTYNSNTERCAEENKFECDWDAYKTGGAGKAIICNYERSQSDTQLHNNVWTWTVRKLK